MGQVIALRLFAVKRSLGAIARCHGTVMGGLSTFVGRPRAIVRCPLTIARCFQRPLVSPSRPGRLDRRTPCLGIGIPHRRHLIARLRHLSTLIRSDISRHRWFAYERETAHLANASHAHDAHCPCHEPVDRPPRRIPDRWQPDPRLKRSGRHRTLSGRRLKRSDRDRRPSGHAPKQPDLDLRPSGRWLRPPDRGLQLPRRWPTPLGHGLQADGVRQMPPTQSDRQRCPV
jgi:hypothetical protein